MGEGQELWWRQAHKTRYEHMCRIGERDSGTEHCLAQSCTPLGVNLLLFLPLPFDIVDG